MDKRLMAAHLVALRLGMSESYARGLYESAIAKFNYGDKRGTSRVVQRAFTAYESYVLDTMDYLAHYGPGYEHFGIGEGGI